MDRRLGTAIVLNILNFLDLGLTLIGTQMSHINFINTEQNPIFIITYSELLAGNPYPFFLLVLIKLVVVFIYTLFLFHFERCFLLSLLFGIVFSLYLTVSFAWVLLIFKAEPMSSLAINWTLICLFLVSFLIYYSPSELKDLF